tara:strand:- start:1918 stop:2850 length:933 start_codon:yes stop_codon:yes gene_type:complete
MGYTISPLRYPGGKYNYFSLFRKIIEKDRGINTFVEPFCGGAGLGLALLKNNIVTKIVLNEYDRFIYLFWDNVLNNTKELITLIDKTNLTVNEFLKWKKLYTDNEFLKSCEDIEIAFGFFIINRATRSGIFNSGPIGGWEKNGKYPIHARFKKDNLIEKIKFIESKKNSIDIFNYDYKDFFKIYTQNNFSLKQRDATLFYFDPPYYKMGKQLYNKYLTKNQHTELRDLLYKKRQYKWILSYDNDQEILNIFSMFKRKNTALNHSIYMNRNRKELLFYSDRIYGKYGKFGSVIVKKGRRVRKEIFSKINQL